MLRNYFVIALRNLVKSWGLSGIKIVGLSVGVCGCIIVFLLVKLELSFDKHHTKGENIYRTYTSFKGVWEGYNHGIALPFPAAFRERAAGVESVAQVLTATDDVTITDGGTEKKFPRPNNIAYLDSNYFNVFPDHKWLVGDPRVLKDPNTVVLTESKAKIYFSTNDITSVIGKRVNYRDSLEVTVVGIVADANQKTDFDFTDFISLSTCHTGWMKKEYDFEEWDNTSSSWLCFIRTNQGTSVENLKSLLADMAKEKLERESKTEEVTTFTSYNLQPLSDIHFDTKLGTWDNGRSATSIGTIEALVVIAVLLLLVAVINFVNLETAQALRRAREVGLRKVMGGTRGSLIAFLVAESFVITFIAIIFALPLTKLSMMFFGEFLPKDLALNLADPFLWSFVIGLTVVVTILSGIYPALVLSSYQPVVALQANRNIGRSGSAFMRKVLTVFQFTFSQVLIAGAMIIGLQIAWMLNKDLGFRHDAIVTVQPAWWESASKRPLLKNELELLSEIEMISQSTKPPASRGTNSTTLRYNNGKEDIPVSVNVCEGDTSYVSLFNLTLIAGRNVQASDSLNEVVINETYCRKLGVAPADMIGKDLKNGSDKVFHVIGVLKDFHHASLHKDIEPWYYQHRSMSRTFSLRLAKDVDLVVAMDKIKEASKKVYGDAEVTITFMDETVQKFYESEQRISKLANTATGLAIFISCLGLFGLASFTAIQRTKEIGIRKVLGASVNSIITLLSRDFVLLVLITFVIATPVAWYIGNEWLNTFPYRMELGVWIFLAAGAMSVIVALITVGFQAVKAAIVNPVDSLRYE
ncbi:MAG TPA: ABC transporter permease [Cyclobacteriaceae bacterium]|nr:ABC transporter permease [Cyclobacteriaceae bacterium]